MVAVTLGEPDGFSGSLAQVIELCSSCLAASDGPYVEHVGRMKREDSLDALLPDHSAYGEGLVNSPAAACDDGAVEYLRADLVALFDSAADIDNIAYLKVRDVVLQALILNGIEYFSLHWYISCVRNSYVVCRMSLWRAYGTKHKSVSTCGVKGKDFLKIGVFRLFGCGWIFWQVIS